MVAARKRGLRRGFTTGTAGAAAAKAAALLLFKRKRVSVVEVTLPGGATIEIPVSKVSIKAGVAMAVVIKDAGDDPDVTDKAVIVAEVARAPSRRVLIGIEGGCGVGRVTKAGLKIRPGRAAINPVPLQMIRRGVREVVNSLVLTERSPVVITISVPRGVELSKKTMNARLGIIGGISILGTTGIVEPMSLSAWRDSITAGMDVAIATGLAEVVFSTGRSSEKVAGKYFNSLPDSAFILTGDHMGFALEEAAKRAKAGLKRVTVCGQFGKFTKLAAGHFKTHCSDSSIDLFLLSELARSLGASGKLAERIARANTAREVFFVLKDEGMDAVIEKVSRQVRGNSQKFLLRKKGRYCQRAQALLVDYNKDVEVFNR